MTTRFAGINGVMLRARMAKLPRSAGGHGHRVPSTAQHLIAGHPRTASFTFSADYGCKRGGHFRVLLALERRWLRTGDSNSARQTALVEQRRPIPSRVMAVISYLETSLDNTYRRERRADRRMMSASGKPPTIAPKRKQGLMLNLDVYGSLVDQRPF